MSVSPTSPSPVPATTLKKALLRTRSCWLIEILFPSNQAETWANVWAYATIPSVQEILVLKTASIGAELLRRNQDGSWPRQPLAIETGELTLESIGFSIPLAAAYRTTRLAANK